MSQEGFKLGKTEVKEIINSEVLNHNISINEKEQQIIDNIVASCPPTLDMHKLHSWCNDKVSEELDKYPDMSEDIVEIRNKIGKELRYKINYQKFEELKKEN